MEDASKVDDVLGAIKNTKAKVILLNMWGIACAPCLAEMPILARVAEKLKHNPNVAFLGLCIPEEGTPKAETLKSAATLMQTKKVAYRNMLWTGNGEALADKFNAAGTPVTIVLSAEGKTLAEIEMPEESGEAAVAAIEKGIAKALETVGAEKK